MSTWTDKLSSAPLFRIFGSASDSNGATAAMLKTSTNQISVQRHLSGGYRSKRAVSPISSANRTVKYWAAGRKSIGLSRLNYIRQRISQRRHGRQETRTARPPPAQNVDVDKQTIIFVISNRGNGK